MNSMHAVVYVHDLKKMQRNKSHQEMHMDDEDFFSMAFAWGWRLEYIYIYFAWSFIYLIEAKKLAHDELLKVCLEIRVRFMSKLTPY